ncbi:MAG: hypothetical protein IT405_03705 [Candidatus Yanofskybacteria bacterium]|nr:hypothetical protein [Candidatus Yanofskybacteria bacterium]
MSSLERPPIPEPAHERMAHDPYAVVAAAYTEVAQVERDPWLRAKIGRLGRKLRVAATLCMLGLVGSMGADGRQGALSPANSVAVEQSAESVEGVIPPAIPSPETIVETLFTGEQQTVLVGRGTWEISISTDGMHTETVERWRSIGKRVRDAMLRNAPKLSERQIEALEEASREGGAPAVLMPAIAAGGAELDRIADEFDDEDDPLLQFFGEIEVMQQSSLTPAERAEAIAGVVAHAQALGITMTWTPDER